MKSVVGALLLALVTPALLLSARRALRRVAPAAASAGPGPHIDWDRRFARFHAAICLVAAAVCAALLAAILISLVTE